MGGHMICWDCGQELDVSSIEKSARDRTVTRLLHALYRDAEALRSTGDYRAADALESLADELSASPEHTAL